jgi:hypothetical protein
MFERYTEQARRVLFFARYEASQLGSISIETEHLLLGLLREESSLAGSVLRENGFELAGLRNEISALPPQTRSDAAPGTPATWRRNSIAGEGPRRPPRPSTVRSEGRQGTPRGDLASPGAPSGALSPVKQVAVRQRSSSKTPTWTRRTQTDHGGSGPCRVRSCLCCDQRGRLRRPLPERARQNFTSHLKPLRLVNSAALISGAAKRRWSQPC